MSAPLTRTVNGYTIERVLDRVAYARNGNVDNPTKSYRYVLRLAGRYLGSFPRLREAVDAAKSGEWS